jgi:hypothetical protein
LVPGFPQPVAHLTASSPLPLPLPPFPAPFESRSISIRVVSLLDIKHSRGEGDIPYSNMQKQHSEGEDVKIASLGQKQPTNRTRGMQSIYLRFGNHKWEGGTIRNALRSWLFFGARRKVCGIDTVYSLGLCKMPFDKFRVLPRDADVR